MLVGVSLHLVDPAIDVVEGSAFRNWVHKDNTISVAIEDACDWSELLGPCLSLSSKPTVSHTCILIISSPIRPAIPPKSTPIVSWCSWLNMFLVARNMIELLPTAESPTIMILNRAEQSTKSYWLPPELATPPLISWKSSWLIASLFSIGVVWGALVFFPLDYSIYIKKVTTLRSAPVRTRSPCISPPLLRPAPHVSSSSVRCSSPSSSGKYEADCCLHLNSSCWRESCAWISRYLATSPLAAPGTISRLYSLLAEVVRTAQIVVCLSPLLISKHRLAAECQIQ